MKQQHVLLTHHRAATKTLHSCSAPYACAANLLLNRPKQALNKYPTQAPTGPGIAGCETTFRSQANMAVTASPLPEASHEPNNIPWLASDGAAELSSQTTTHTCAALLYSLSHGHKT
jgi:hypothetical protein